MTQFQEEILKDREDNLSEIYASNVYNAPGPDDDDDWISDDDEEDFDVESDDDIDEDYTSPAVIPDADEEDDTWVDDDEDDLLGDDDEDEDATLEDDDDEVTEGDRITRGDLGSNFDERSYGRNRRTGRMIDHEPGSTGSGDPNLE